MKTRLELEIDRLQDLTEQLAIARDQLTPDLAVATAALTECEAARDEAQVGGC